MSECRRCKRPTPIKGLTYAPERWDCPVRLCGPCYVGMRALYAGEDAQRRRCARCGQSFPSVDLRRAPSTFYAAQVCAFCWGELNSAYAGPSLSFKPLVDKLRPDAAAKVPPPAAYPKGGARDELLRADAEWLDLTWNQYRERYAALLPAEEAMSEGVVA